MEDLVKIRDAFINWSYQIYHWRIHQKKSMTRVITFPETKSEFLHLKLDGWKMNVSFWDFAYVHRLLLYSFRECNVSHLKNYAHQVLVGGFNPFEKY